MRDSIGFHAMNFIAILFAYLVAGYFATRLLSGFQAVSATIFYLILAPMPALAAQEAISDYVLVFLEYHERFAFDQPISLYMRYAPDAWLIAVTGTITLSIICMVQSGAVGKTSTAPTNDSLDGNNV